MDEARALVVGHEGRGAEVARRVPLAVRPRLSGEGVGEADTREVARVRDALEPRHAGLLEAGFRQGVGEQEPLAHLHPVVVGGFGDLVESVGHVL